MFRPFRSLLAALTDLATEMNQVAARLRVISELQESAGPATNRLDRLERDHHTFQAECEGLLMKAEGKLRAANNAEARERANKRSYEHLLDAFPEDGDGLPPAGSADTVHDAPPGEEERLSALRLDVAPLNKKTLAQRAKFGVR